MIQKCAMDKSTGVTHKEGKERSDYHTRSSDGDFSTYHKNHHVPKKSPIRYWSLSTELFKLLDNIV